MIKWFKKYFLKRRLKRLYKLVQKLTEVKFSLRMKSIKLGQSFNETADKLEELGVNNPKELVIGKRPPTGRVK